MQQRKVQAPKGYHHSQVWRREERSVRAAGQRAEKATALYNLLVHRPVLQPAVYPRAGELEGVHRPDERVGVLPARWRPEASFCVVRNRAAATAAAVVPDCEVGGPYEAIDAQPVAARGVADACISGLVRHTDNAFTVGEQLHRFEQVGFAHPIAADDQQAWCIDLQL